MTISVLFSQSLYHVFTVVFVSRDINCRNRVCNARFTTSFSYWQSLDLVQEEQDFRMNFWKLFLYSFHFLRLYRENNHGIRQSLARPINGPFVWITGFCGYPFWDNVSNGTIWMGNIPKSYLVPIAKYIRWCTDKKHSLESNPCKLPELELELEKLTYVFTRNVINKSNVVNSL